MLDIVSKLSAFINILDRLVVRYQAMSISH